MSEASVGEPLDRVVEALLFVATTPVTTRELAHAAGVEEPDVEGSLARLRGRHGEGRSGVVLERVGAGWALRAASEAVEACARLLDRGAERALSAAALETLAIVAYAGPVSRPEIARIRGVSADAAVAGLLERGLIEEAGRADRPGQPVLYRTTPSFHRAFGLEEGDGSLPPLDDLVDADGAGAIRDRLEAMAAARRGDEA